MSEAVFGAMVRIATVSSTETGAAMTKSSFGSRVAVTAIGCMMTGSVAALSGSAPGVSCEKTDSGTARRNANRSPMNATR